MKTHPFTLTRNRTGMTLVEMSVVVLVMMTLMGVGFVFSNKLREWRLGREASETLRAVYAAQRMYLSDNPTQALATVNQAQLLPYMPPGTNVFPTIESLEGEPLAITVNVSPPVIEGNYDPSKIADDGMWDVGK